MLDFSKDCKVVLMNTSAAAGQGTTNTAIFDLGQPGIAGGFDAIAVLVILNAVVSGATVQVNLQDNTANSTSGMANCTASYASVGSQNTGSATVVQDTGNCGLIATDVGTALSNSVLVLDVMLPQLRFVRAVIVRAVANSTIGGVVGILYRTKVRPIVQDASNLITGLFTASS